MAYKDIINVLTDCISQKTETITKTGRCKSQRNLWKNMPVGWTCRHSRCLINGLLLCLTDGNKNVHCITFWQVHTKIHHVPRLRYRQKQRYTVFHGSMCTWLPKTKATLMMLFSNTNRNTHCSRTLCVLDANSNVKCFMMRRHSWRSHSQ
jgi:hypothetical protein